MVEDGSGMLLWNSTSMTESGYIKDFLGKKEAGVDSECRGFLKNTARKGQHWRDSSFWDLKFLCVC